MAIVVRDLPMLPPREEPLPVSPDLLDEVRHVLTRVARRESENVDGTPAAAENARPPRPARVAKRSGAAAAKRQADGRSETPARVILETSLTIEPLAPCETLR